MVAQEYKNIIKKKYQDKFIPLNYQYFCDVYNDIIDIWVIDIKLNYLQSIYIPFKFEEFNLQITMWYEDDLGITKKKIWKTS